MKKYTYAFYVLGALLLVLSLSNFVGAILSHAEFIESATRTDISVPKWKHLQYLSFSSHSVIYPIVLSVTCLFLAKLAKIFDGPDVVKNLKHLIRDIRAAGDMTNG